MSDRREFLKLGMATAAGLAVGVVGVQDAGATGMKKMMSKKDLDLPGILYTEENLGMWAEKIELHLPEVTVEGMKVTLLTPHPMTAEHHIVRHTVVAADGTVVGGKTFYPDKDQTAQSSYELKAKGKYVATSFCNKHDMWVREFEV